MKFQDDISNMNTYIHTYIRTRRNQYMSPTFSKLSKSNDPHRHPCNLSPAMPKVPYPLSEGAVVTNDWCLCCDYIKKYSLPIGFLYFYQPIMLR